MIDMARGGWHREYDSEQALSQRMEPFPRWLRAHCSNVGEGDDAHVEELRALACRPSRRVCSFRSMLSHGSHYRVEGEGGGATHVTYDCGVAELRERTRGGGLTAQSGVVEIVRVGTLRDILVFNYSNNNVVVMVVSWLTKDTELQPRLRRDAHGFWLANMAAMPRCSENPYILPSLASQVGHRFSFFFFLVGSFEMCILIMWTSCTNNGDVQVFFVPDKANLGWSVVLQKEARGRRINSTEEDLCIGQEESCADRELFAGVGTDTRRERGDENDRLDVAPALSRRVQARRE